VYFTIAPPRPPSPQEAVPPRPPSPDDIMEIAPPLESNPIGVSYEMSPSSHYIS